jgi:hypothetical protein
VLFVLASEEYVIESGLWSSCEHFIESRILMEIIKLSNCFFNKASALDLDDASETRRHEMEIKFLLVIIEPLSMAEFSLEMIERFKFATSWSIDMLLVTLARIIVYRIRNL